MNRLKMLVVAAAATLSLSSCGYNSMVEKQEAVDAAWAQVENVYQRRSDLIPNLVATVKGYAAHESETLEAVVAARAQATSANIDASQLSEANLEKFQAAQSNLSQALGKLMMVREAYPELKANENFRDLQAQLEGTENRISVERKRFNDTTRDYNTYIRKFPQNLIAMMFDFEQKPYFKAEEGAEQAPKVEF